MKLQPLLCALALALSFAAVTSSALAKDAPKHCDTHPAAANHDCAKHCAEHPGAKDADCAAHCSKVSGLVKDHACDGAHCDKHLAAAAKQCNALNCATHPGKAGHDCNEAHCAKHGGNMADCCGTGQRCDV